MIFTYYREVREIPVRRTAKVIPRKSVCLYFPVPSDIPHNGDDPSAGYAIPRV